MAGGAGHPLFFVGRFGRNTMRSPWLLAALLLLATPVSSQQDAGPPEAAAPPPCCTVGDLAVRLAGRLALPVPEPGPEPARAALLVRGIEIEGDLDRRLLEGDLVDVLNQMDLHLITSWRDRPVDSEKIDLVLGMLRLPPAAATQPSN
jgi:hypothetical protein